MEREFGCESNITQSGHILLVTNARSYRGSAFARAAAALGIEVTPVIDMDPALAQHWNTRLGVPFSDPHAAAAAIAGYANAQPIDAVLAVDDSGTLVAALAAAALGLTHNSPIAAEAARNKVKMRTLLSASGVPCPWFQSFSTAEPVAFIAATVPYPCVVKPVNLNGSRGVMRADTPEQLAEAIRRLEKMLRDEEPEREAYPFLIESFIPGREVALEGLLDDGQLIVLALFDKPNPLDGPFFEETIYVTPSRLPDSLQKEIAACAEDACRALGLRIGPVHAELRINEQGAWVLEVAGRSIGGLCSQTLRFGVDQSLEELILRQACGLPLETIRERQASGVMMIPIPATGVLHKVEGLDEAGQVDGVDSVEITAKLHYSITPLPEGESYLGFIFARGPDPAFVENALRASHAMLHFTILPEFRLEEA